MTTWTTAGLALSLLTLAAPQAIPRTAAETASGGKLTLPDALVGHTTILVIGFSKTSAKASEWWEARLSDDVARPTGISIMRVAHLEAIPRLLRGLLLGKIKDNVRKEKRDTFLMLFDEEDAWKKLVGFDAPDEAYITLVDSAGESVWRSHAGIDESAYRAIRTQLEAALQPEDAGTAAKRQDGRE